MDRFEHHAPGQYEYEGVVINSSEKLVKALRNYVLVLRSPAGIHTEENEQIYVIHERAFDLNIPADSLDFSIFAELKCEARRMAEPLRFGATVLWNTKDLDVTHGIINSFHRERAIYPVKSDENGLQFLIGGCIQPGDTKFWNDFRPVHIPPAEAVKAEPDVWLTAWLRVSCTGSSLMNVKLEVTFIKFDRFYICEQHRVMQAPWHNNLNITKFSMMQLEPSPADDDDLIDCQNPPAYIRPQDKWQSVLNSQMGLYVGNRLVVSKDLPQYDFIIPLEMAWQYGDKGTEIYPTIGEYVFIRAYWSTNHRCFLIDAMAPAQQYRNYQLTLSNNIYVKVRAHEEYIGFFYDDNLGLIDDPDHCFVFFNQWPGRFDQARKPVYIQVELRAVRTSENKSVRFRIVKRSHKCRVGEAYVNWLNNNKITVTALKGVLANRTHAYSADLPNVRFRMPNNGEAIACGTGIQFDAELIKGVENSNDMQIIRFTKLTDRFKALNVVQRDINKRDLPILQLMLTRDPKYEQLVYSPLIGFVDTRGDLDVTEQRFRAWVCESNVKSECREASTHFYVLSTALAPPQNLGGLKTQSSAANSSTGASSKDSKTSHSSLSSKRFAGLGDYTQRRTANSASTSNNG